MESSNNLAVISGFTANLDTARLLRFIYPASMKVCHITNEMTESKKRRKGQKPYCWLKMRKWSGNLPGKYLKLTAIKYWRQRVLPRHFYYVSGIRQQFIC